MAATDMLKAGLEIGCLAYCGEHDCKVESINDNGTTEILLGGDARLTSVLTDSLVRDYADAQKARHARFETLSEHYPGEAGVPEESDTIERFCLVQTNQHLGAFEHAFVWGDTFEACVTETDAGGEVLDGWLPEAVFDLDTGARIEVHVSSPVISRSEDQGVMHNVLGVGNDGAHQ